MRITALLLLIVLPGMMQAQDVRVAYIKSITGKSQVTRNGKAVLLQIGSLIYNTDQLLVGKGSQLMLLGRSNKYYEILKPGKYTYAEIEKKVEEKPTGITDDFFHLLWEDLIHHQSGAKVTGNKIGEAVGGAIRGKKTCILNEPLNMTHTSADTIRFSWKPVPGARNYGFSISENGNGEIVHIITTDTCLLLLKRILLKGKMSTYSWKVTTADRQDCEVIAQEFSLYNPETEAEKAAAVVMQIDKEDNQFIYYLKISQLLAEQGWLSKSLEYYNKAKAEPILR